MNYIQGIRLFKSSQKMASSLALTVDVDVGDEEEFIVCDNGKCIFECSNLDEIAAFLCGVLYARREEN